MNLLFIGDIFGEPGRWAVEKALPLLREKYRLDFVVANGENIVHGRGVNSKMVEALFSAGVDVVTTGNHAFDQDESHSYFKSQNRLLRPANYSKLAPGRGWTMRERCGVEVAVVNLSGRIHMEPADCPFACIDEILGQIKPQADIVIVDMHAEATSETRAMGWYLDGKVAAVLGSHTHVQTADEEILPQGTAYLSDAGMTGPYRSVIGINIEKALLKFRTGIRQSFQPAQEDIRFCAVYVKIEESTGLAEKIERVQERLVR